MFIGKETEVIHWKLGSPREFHRGDNSQVGLWKMGKILKREGRGGQKVFQAKEKKVEFHMNSEIMWPHKAGLLGLRTVNM